MISLKRANKRIELKIGDLDSHYVHIALVGWSKWTRGHFMARYWRGQNHRCYCPVGSILWLELAIRGLIGIFIAYSYFPRHLAPCYCDEVVRMLTEGEDGT